MIRLYRGGRILTLDAAWRVVQAIAVAGERIAAVGSDEEVSRAFPSAAVTELSGATVIPGLVDGHAHLDREGLKAQLPSLEGVDSIEALVDRLRELAARTAPGRWIVTMPLGSDPEYRSGPGLFREGRMPDRADLDRASGEHPIFIRPPWGYWSRQLPLVGIANSRALAAAGIGRDTRSPTAQLEFERDASGELTGRILEHSHMPIAELTFFRLAAGFTEAQREAALVESMRRYNAAGTTSVFEGHGVAPQVIAAHQRLREAGRSTVRSRLVFSPSWSGVSQDDIRGMVGSWARWLAGRGLGDDRLRVAGLYTEIDDSPEVRLRASCAPDTGWAGFCYDSALPKDAVVALLAECARNGVRVCGIYANLLELYAEADRVAPIAGQRWILGHQSMLSEGDLARIRDLGIALTLHTNAHIYKRGDEFRAKVGPAGERSIVPLRRLLDAGITTALSTDNVPVSMFHPVWQVVARKTRGGHVLSPEEAVTREEALRCATLHGAALSFEEGDKGSLEPGKLADFAVLDADPLGVPLENLPGIRARMTVVGGEVVYKA